MLVLTRRRGERLLIGNDIEIVVTRVVDGQVRLAIQAPKGAAMTPPPNRAMTRS